MNGRLAPKVAAHWEYVARLPTQIVIRATTMDVAFTDDLPYA
jgi:hypothetical protein